MSWWKQQQPQARTRGRLCSICRKGPQIPWEEGAGATCRPGIQNEPNAGVLWDGAFIQRAVSGCEEDESRFDANGLQKVKIHGRKALTWMATGAAWRNRPSDLYNDAELNKAIGAIIHHTYDQWSWGTKDVTSSNTATPQSARERISGWRMVQSWSGAPIDKTLNEMRHLARDLVVIKNNYWVWWMGWWSTRPNNAEQTLLHGNPSNPTKTQRFYFQRLWNSPGYVVKHLTTNDPDLKERQHKYRYGGLRRC